MTLLLDTCVLLHALLSPERLSPSASAILRDRASNLVWSAASTWEVMIKCRLGSLSLGEDPVATLHREMFRFGLHVLPVEQRHAAQVWSLPSPGAGAHRHADPFDRLLIAQAIVEELPVLTSDVRFDGYGIQRVW